MQLKCNVNATYEKLNWTLTWAWHNFSHSLFQFFGQIFSPTENFAILFALLLIFYIVLGLALLVYVKSICKLNKLSKMTLILRSKVPFSALERHIRLVPRIFTCSEFSEMRLIYYFFYFLWYVIIYILLLQVHLGVIFCW